VTSALLLAAEKWPGVDESVVARVAAEAGRAPRPPLVEGDLLLFLFLVAGIVGGFALGYYFRALFVERVGAERPR
jgi:cobalt/nickel transport system permease protein